MKGEPNYYAKQDYGKAKLTLVPRRILWDIAAIREYGNNKYPEGGPDNWKAVEVNRYRDAAFRHFLGYLDDPLSIDTESGLPHLWHLACNIAFLCEMEDMYLSKNPEVVERLKKEFHTEFQRPESSTDISKDDIYEAGDCDFCRNIGTNICNECVCGTMWAPMDEKSVLYKQARDLIGIVEQTTKGE